MSLGGVELRTVRNRRVMANRIFGVNGVLLEKPGRKRTLPQDNALREDEQTYH